VSTPDITVFEDHIRINISDASKRHTTVSKLLENIIFEEVIAGIEDICIKYDPMLHDEKSVITGIENILKTPPIVQNIQFNSHIFMINVDQNSAPDFDMVCNTMAMSHNNFMDWLLDRHLIVDMMGFQPGFAYLTHDGSTPQIDRLNKPRSFVKSGSIGFLGDSACIYAHDGPGGWPIIGRVNRPIFNKLSNPPNILSSGDNIKFILETS